MKQPFIEITGMKIGEFIVPVPHGLSELVHEANAWVVLDEEPKHENFDREVVKRNGKVVTILRKKEKQRERRLNNDTKCISSK